MGFLIILAASMVIGNVARPLFMSEEMGKAAFTAAMIFFVVTAAENAEESKPLHPTTRTLLSPFRHKYVYLAIQILAFSWLFAHTSPKEFFGRLFK